MADFSGLGPVRFHDKALIRRPLVNLADFRKGAVCVEVFPEYLIGQPPQIGIGPVKTFSVSVREKGGQHDLLLIAHIQIQLGQAFPFRRFEDRKGVSLLKHFPDKLFPPGICGRFVRNHLRRIDFRQSVHNHPRRIDLRKWRLRRRIHCHHSIILHIPTFLSGRLPCVLDKCPLCPLPEPPAFSPAPRG